MTTVLAFDKMEFNQGSARHTDSNGYLHVAESHISKATVNPYYGKEIPGSEELGLVPDKVYHLLRDPEELKKAAPTFDNLPLLDKHVPLSSFNLDDPEIKKHLVGSTGTDAAFKDGYLDNSLVIHTNSAIKDVEAKTKHELSSAYRYVPDMTPGVFEGHPYDGVMRKIEGNHVSLVSEGRAGHDVKVMDEKMAECAITRSYFDRIRRAMGLPGDMESLGIRRAMGLDAKDCAAGSITVAGKDIAKRKDVNPSAGKSKYGDVSFADEKNKKYPLDKPEHVSAAASYFGMAKNRAKYSKEDATKIDKRIRAAEKKFKIGEFAEGK